MIDTLALAERPEREYGDDPERARHHAHILSDMLAAGDIATKQDVSELRAEIAQLRTEMLGIGQRLDAKVDGLEQRLDAKIEGAEQLLRAELHREIGAVRGEMGGLAWKMAGLLLARAAAIVALIKLLPGAGF